MSRKKYIGMQRALMLAAFVLGIWLSPSAAAATRGFMPGHQVAGLGYESPGVVNLRFSLHGMGYFLLLDGEPGRWLGLEELRLEEAGQQARPFALAFGGPLFGGQPLALGLGLDFDVLTVAVRDTDRTLMQQNVGAIGAFVYLQATGRGGALTVVGGEQLFGRAQQLRTHIDAYLSFALDRRGVITPYISASYGQFDWRGERYAGYQFVAGLSLGNLLGALR